MLLDYKNWKQKKSFKFNIKESVMLEASLDEQQAIDFIGCFDEVEEVLKVVVYYWREYFGIISMSGKAFNISFFLNIAAQVIKEQKHKEKKIFNNKDRFEDTYKQVVRYSLHRTLMSDYSSGTASKVMDDINQIFNQTLPELSEDDLKSLKERIELDLNQAKYNNKNTLYALMIGQMSLSNPLSLSNGTDKVVVLPDLWKSLDKDQHHFLPKKCPVIAKNFGEEINNFENIFLISESENREIIKNRNPFEYFLEDKRGSMDLDNLLERTAKSHDVAKEELALLLTETIESSEQEKVIRRILSDRKEKLTKKLLEALLIT